MWKGIRRMLDFYRRCWHVFLPLSGGLFIGIAPAIYYSQWKIVVALSTLAAICLVIGFIGFIKAFQYARKEEREAKAAKDKADREAKAIRDYEALKESFKRSYIEGGKSPEEAERLAEIAARGRPYTPPIEEEGEGNS